MCSSGGFGLPNFSTLCFASKNGCETSKNPVRYTKGKGSKGQTHPLGIIVENVKTVGTVEGSISRKTLESETRIS